jgi:hypothetical protein
MRTEKRSLYRALVLLVGAILAWSAPASAQVSVVNMVPASNSGETSRDAEPNLAVAPANPLMLAASAFTLTRTARCRGSCISRLTAARRGTSLMPLYPPRPSWAA